MQGEGLRLRAFTSYGICREGLRKSFTELFPRRAATDAARDGGCVWHTGDAHPGRAGCAWSRNAHSAACATFAGGALAEMMRHQHQRKAIEWRAGFISIWTVRWTAVYNTVRLEDLKTVNCTVLLHCQTVLRGEGVPRVPPASVVEDSHFLWERSALFLGDLMYRYEYGRINFKTAL